MPSRSPIASEGHCRASSAGLCAFWGSWFGRPYDNQHRIVDCEAEGEILRLRFNEGELLSVFSPRNASIDEKTFRIDDANRVRWEWFYCGRAKTPENQYLSLRQSVVRLLPLADSLQCFLPPSRPLAAPAHNLGGRLVTDVSQAATKIQAIVFSFLAPSRVESITRLAVRRRSGSGRMPGVWHAAHTQRAVAHCQVDIRSCHERVLRYSLTRCRVIAVRLVPCGVASRVSSRLDSS